MGTCNRCELGQDTHKTKGHGPRDAKIMIIGEAPGYSEELTGMPFQGKAGKLLDRLLQEAGLDRDEIYVTNVCKCRPPQNRTPKSSEIKACMPYLWREIERVKPEILVLLGNTALYAVTGLKGVKTHRGQWIDVEGLSIMPTLHPASALRNPGWDVKIKSDLIKVANFATEKMPQIDEIPYTYVKSKDDLRVYLQTAKDSVDHSYDIETIVDTDIVLCMASTFEMPDGRLESFFIPLAHHESCFKKFWPEVMKVIAPTISHKGVYKDLKTTGQNAKFDNKKFRRNVKCDPYLTFDTMLAAHLVDENTPNALAYIAPTYANAPAWKEEVDSKRLDEFPILQVAKYNVADTYWTLKTKYVLKKMLKDDGRLWKIFLHCTMPGARALERAEHRGLYIDEVQLAKMSSTALANMWTQMQELAKFLPDGHDLQTCLNCRRRTGTDPRLQKCPTPDRIREGYCCKKYSAPKGTKVFNINSSQQMGWLLFDVCEIDPVHYTEAGKPSTAEDSLVYMDHPLVEVILKYREWEKLWTTYLRPWGEMRDEHGRIYPSAKIHGTVTGRLSYSKPNPQTVPRNVDIRSIICAPPGWVFMEIDYSQIELRGVAHAAPEPTMLRIYQTGGDIHLETACVMTGKMPEDITKDERKKAKAVNFGFVYGMGWRKFVEYAKSSYGVDFTEEEAKEIRRKFFAKYKGLKPWHDRQKRIANQLGYVRSAFGRKRRLPEVYSDDDGKKAEAERQSVNSPIQALPPDMTMMALGLMDKEPGMWKECFCVAQVHDALLFEVREDKVDKWARIGKRIMENLPLQKVFGMEFLVPIVAEPQIGPAWGKGVEWHDTSD